MRILALDCGTKTGWSTNINGNIESGVAEFAVKRGESPGMKFLMFTSWLRKMLEITKPELVVFEQSHLRGGFASDILVGMVTRIQEQCVEKKIEYASVHSASLKKFATKKGNASKEDMIIEAKRRYPKIKIIDDNHADALMLLTYAKNNFE